MKKIFLTWCIIWLLITGCKNNSEEPVPVAEMKIMRDIAYVAGDTSDRRKLDVYYETGSDPSKVIFFIPGGAWKQGDKNMYDAFGQTLCKYFHFTVVVINYRLSDSTQGDAVHPDHIHDVAAAYQWTHQHINEFNGDPGRVFVFGQSAGAHLAALLVADQQYLQGLGLTRGPIMGLIVMSGPYNLNHFVNYPANPLGLNMTDVLMYRVMIDNAFGTIDSATIAAASPAYYVEGGLPPVLIIHTEYDMPGLSAENERFFTQLEGLGTVPVTLFQLLKSDYSPETWSAATEMAAAEPAVSDYIGHYAELVAVNQNDRNKVPTTWIVSFINQY
jgi:acetyl esterase/lipase